MDNDNQAIYKIGVLTISDRSSAGQRDDASGPAARDLLLAGIPGAQLAQYEVVPDEQQEIAAALRQWCDNEHLALIVTTGGTGLAPRDVTPEATRGVLDYDVPGIAEVMRAVSMTKTPMAMLSRAMAGVRGRSLIINLPGSPKAVRECLEAILPALPHGLAKLAGDPAECGPNEQP